MENVKEIIAKNLVELRKSRKMTQQELADKINYSDKAISRWEHAETLPDIETLCKLCDIYGVKFEYLLQKEQPKKNNLYKVQDTTGNKIAITLIAIVAVWLIALVAYVYVGLSANSYIWQFFIWAIPGSTLVGQICNKMWGKRFMSYILASLTVWTLILALVVTMADTKAWMLFLIGIPVQLILILMLTMRPSGR